MKKKFSYLVKASLKKKIQTKSFKISNVVLAILIIGIINIDSIITFFGGNFNNDYDYYIIDEVGVYETFENQLSLTSKSIYGEDKKINISKYEDDINNLEDKIKEKNSNIAIKFLSDADNIFKVELISKEKIDTIEYQVLLSTFSNIKIFVGSWNTGCTSISNNPELCLDSWLKPKND